MLNKWSASRFVLPEKVASFQLRKEAGSHAALPLFCPLPAGPQAR